MLRSSQIIKLTGFLFDIIGGYPALKSGMKYHIREISACLELCEAFLPLM